MTYSDNNRRGIRIRQTPCSGPTELPAVFRGTVTHGKQLGRTIGMPTANIIPDSPAGELPYGVYYSAITVRGRRYPSISNMGVRPSVEGGATFNIETFIYDFSEDIYGEAVSVELLGFKRPEFRFSSVADLAKQMQLDMEEGRKFHGLAGR